MRPQPHRPPSPPRANPGRVGAARALLAVDEGEALDEASARLLPEEPADRALGWHLAFGVVRRRASVDAALRPWLRQPLDALDPPVRASLRVAAYELLYGRAKAYAAVDQGVETARALGAGRASGLVNAVLRRVVPLTSPSRAVLLDHPAWLVARWDARYGPEATEAWCTSNLEPPPLFVVGRGDAAGLAGQLAEAGALATPAEVKGVVVPGVLRLEGGGRVEELPGYATGAFWVQDVASAWMTDLVPAEAQRVLDACAAPGGKTFRLAARGAQVVATDRSPLRLERLTASLARLDLTADVRVHDWERGPVDGLGTFDAVLVDAPCTALGTLRRNPEIKWRRGPFDPVAMAPVQQAVVQAAAHHVRPGGALVYVVCSPESEEGPDVVAAFLADHAGWTREVERTTAPALGGEDAFWGVRLRRPLEPAAR